MGKIIILFPSVHYLIFKLISYQFLHFTTFLFFYYLFSIFIFSTVQSFGEPYTSIVRAVTMVRYSLLPLWYTAFYEAYTTGQPVMRTMFSEFPDDQKTFTMDDQWLIGSSLLVKPVTGEGQTNTFIYLPISSDTDGWYDLNKLQRTPSVQGGFHTVESPLSHIPVYIRAGTL